MTISAQKDNIEDNKLRILVTGAYGQLGHELREAFEAAGITSVVYVDRDVLDLTDGDSVRNFMASERFTHIVNCAAYTAVDKAEAEADVCRGVNVAGVKNIVDAIKGSGTKLIHISTDFVFDGKKRSPYTEADATGPLSVYGQTKLESERYVVENLPSDGIVLRTSWLYSSHGHNFVKTILRRALSGQPLRVVDDQTGTPTYAADLAEAILSIILSEKTTAGLFHFSNIGETTWYGFACEILKAANLSAEISPCSTSEYVTAAVRPAYSVLDKSKIIDTYNLSIPEWRRSLARCMEKIDLKAL